MRYFSWIPWIRNANKGEYIMSFSFKVVFCIALLLAPLSAWAVHPLQVEDTATQGKGNFLFELNGDYTKDNEFKTTTMNANITVGAGQRTDLVLETPYLLQDPSGVTGQYEHGTGDIRVKLKHQLFENEVHQSMGYQIYADMPTGNADKGLGRNDVFWGFKLMDSQGCCSTIYRVSAGYEVLGRDVKDLHFGNDYSINFGFAVEHKLTEAFRLLAEVAGENRREDGLYSRPFTALFGFKYDISRSWYVDVAGRAGLNRYAEDYTALLGTAWKF